MNHDPYLTFQVIDSNEEFDVDCESNSSGIPNSYIKSDDDDDDNLSDLLSASQIGTIMADAGFPPYSDPSYTQSVRLSTATSHLSDYFSEEDDNKSSESLIFTCTQHGLQYTDVNEFEEHQVNYHTINGRFLCGLCDRHYASKYLRRSHVQGAHLGAKFVCSVQNCGKKFSQKKYRDAQEKGHTKIVDTSLRYICDYCNSVFDQMEKLQQHKLMHSSTKRFICKFCKVHGYTRASDCRLHEDECDMNPDKKVNEDNKTSDHSVKKLTKKKKRSTSEINLWSHCPCPQSFS